MTRDLALDDPEVRADLALRDRAARDRRDRRGPEGLEDGQDPDGLSPALARLYDSVPAPVVVERVPCAKGCNTVVDVLDAALTAFEAVNAALVKRGQRPVAKAHGFICDACKRRDDELAQAQRRPHEQQHMAGMAPAKGRP